MVTTSLAAACGGGGDGHGGVIDPGNGGGTPVSAATVNAAPTIQFTRATIELTADRTVTFDFGPVQHNVYFDNALPGAPANIPAPTANESIVRTFPVAGRYRFTCHVHPGMSGVINVH